jgi:uncharacterized membrane protein
MGNNILKSKRGLAIAAGIAIILLVSVFIEMGNSGDSKSKTASTGKDIISNSSETTESTTAGDLIIPKSEITETAKFYPYNANGTRMEILAVKAGDGSIRTAFNTCQICNGSPKAYYKQQGNVLVCQNCGNRFNMDMVEQERGGCNPVPIVNGEKNDDGTNITISKDFIVKNKDLFTANWKTQ